MIKETFDEITRGLEDRTVRFEMKALPPAQADPVLLRQVFMNLLTNAVKFSRGKDMSIIEVGGWSEGDENIFYIKDNGIGFDMKYGDKIFDVFQRLHSPKDFEGSGIGLSIVQRIIQRHGGCVWAEGQLNEGATFYFSLPQR